MKLMILTPTHAFTRLLTGLGAARREKLRLVIKDIIMTLRQLLIMNNPCWLIALQLNAIQRHLNLYSSVFCELVNRNLEKGTR